MPTEIETRSGRCATHGVVDGTREVPKLAFPWIVNSIRRAMARRRSFVCPTCGQAIEVV
jgi:hypothetical protein